MIKFAHISDMHIDHGQFRGLARRERRDDFARSAMWTAEEIIANECDFALFCGDTFDSLASSVYGRSTARAIFGALKKEDVKCIAVCGNHDGVDGVDGLSLLHELEEQEYVTLLDGAMSFKDTDIYGIPWAGAATLSAIADLDILESSNFKILMLHAGIEGLMPTMYPESVPVDVLKSVPVDYVAMGHIHKPYDDGFIRMPGSLEAVNRSEVKWEGGINIVTVEDGLAYVKHVKCPRREWNIVEVDLTGKAADDLSEELSSESFPEGSILTIVLTGIRDFEINRHAIRMAVKSEVLVIEIDNKSIVSATDEVFCGTRAEIEEKYFESCLGVDAGLAMSVMDMALGDSGPSEIANVL